MSKRSKISSNASAKLERLYEKYKNMMHAVAYRILKDNALAEDAVHQSFVKIVNKLDRIEEENVPKTKSFLNIICKNVAIDMYNDLKSEKQSVDSIDAVEFSEMSMTYLADEPFHSLLHKETNDKLLAKINELSDIYKDVIILEYLYEYSMKEIAELLNLSYDTVKKRSERARKILCEILVGEECFHEEKRKQ